MGCLEQGNPLISRLGGEGVLCVLGGFGFGAGRVGAGVLGSGGMCPVLPGRNLGGGHLRPHGAHLLGCLLQ